MMQNTFFFTQFVFVFILLICLSLCLTIAIRNLPNADSEERTGLLAAYLKWVNTKPPDVEASKSFPRYATHEGLDSMLCPVCGAKISSRDAKQLEYGYSIECAYCGVTIRSPRMHY